ncbi:MAG: xylose isomerase [Bacteroidetes bacterium]|nr:MAG: xylose isomerase [Bacteroidota bacterium]
MQRRKFFKQSLYAGGAALAGVTFTDQGFAQKADARPFHLNYAIHDGMFKNSAGNNFLDQIQFAYDNGFRSIEDNGMMDRPADQQEKIGSKLASLNMKMGVFVHGFDHWPVSTSLCSGNKEWRDKFLDYTKRAVDVSKRCQGKLVTVVPGNFERKLPIGYQTAHVIESLRRAAEILEPHQIVMVLEPLSDTPDLFLRYPDQAFAICKAVNSPSCKILFDIFHMQRNVGDLISNIDLAWEEIAYFQIGDNPGRNEPGTGEINYKNIFRHLYQKGYQGILGMEHGNSIPGKEGELALIKAYREVDNFLS